MLQGSTQGFFKKSDTKGHYKDELNKIQNVGNS